MNTGAAEKKDAQWREIGKPDPARDPRPEPLPEIAAPPPPPRRGWLFGIAFALAGGLLAFGIVGGRAGEDPHYVQARQIVERYEMGREEESRDYENVAYQEALAQLALVLPSSASSGPAEAMAADIRSRIATQRARVKAQSDEIARRQEMQHRRNEEIFAQQRLAPPDPEGTQYPECDDEEEHGHSP